MAAQQKPSQAARKLKLLSTGQQMNG